MPRDRDGSPTAEFVGRGGPARVALAFQSPKDGILDTPAAATHNPHGMTHGTSWDTDDEERPVWGGRLG
ncbi:hypothetical protein MMYC01_209295 [Madurella mycetomatis]|uniref:Uncharacterized protein n=1 Tax=Madurella mycetomatis TaxID=100816 RepID=A0A175VZS1_9PEZI|nr:hypothetical protein MMYC01_209295 [Madurella mycetomatis]